MRSCACAAPTYPLANGEGGELSVGRDGEVANALDRGEVADGEGVRFGGVGLHVGVEHTGETVGQHHGKHGPSQRGQTRRRSAQDDHHLPLLVILQIKNSQSRWITECQKGVQNKKNNCWFTRRVR